MNSKRTVQTPKLTPRTPDDAMLFGTCPEGAEAWQCKRAAPDGKLEGLSFESSDGVKVFQWPLDELSLVTIRDRWGIGRYRVAWLGKNRVAMGRTQVIELTQQPEVVAAVPSPVPQVAPVDASFLPPGFQQMLMIQQMFDEKARAAYDRDRERDREDRERDRRHQTEMMQMVIARQDPGELARTVAAAVTAGVRAALDERDREDEELEDDEEELPGDGIPKNMKEVKTWAAVQAVQAAKAVAESVPGMVESIAKKSKTPRNETIVEESHHADDGGGAERG